VRERERKNTCENNDEHAMGWGVNIKAHRQEGRKIAFVLTTAAAASSALVTFHTFPMKGERIRRHK
jgi:hypothetical protein